GGVRRRRSRRELDEAEAREPESGAGITRERAREIVRRAARRADDDEFGCRGSSGAERARRGEPRRGGRGGDYSNHRRAPPGRWAGDSGKGKAEPAGGRKYH